MIDVLAALRTVLLADDGVAALCGTRVWAAELPKAEVTNMPRANVVLAHAGGFERMATDPRVRPRVDVYSYGETFFSAGQLDRAVYDALKALRRRKVGEALIHGVALAGGPIQLRDSDAGWPVLVTSVSVATDERAIEE
jgi:hypothetical protein